MLDTTLINQLIEKHEQKCASVFEKIDEIALYNQYKVLNAFRENAIGPRHFSQTTGYGYDDVARDTLYKLFADIFGAQSAIASPLIMSGTHALTLALFGLLRPNDVLLSMTGAPYDTLHDVINGKNIGSLADFGVRYEEIDYRKLNDEDIKEKLLTIKPKVVFFQRSRGYTDNKALSIDELQMIFEKTKNILPEVVIVTDNCYGEFTDKVEPTQVGADVIVGSLIKNPGGGIAPTGGYVAGRRDCVEQIAGRFSSPSVGCEVGSYAGNYVPFYQGLFLAPKVTANAMKGAVLFSCAFSELGYKTIPSFNEKPNDIICSINFNTKEELISFCQGVQYASPVDSNVTPYPWDMPGYNHQVIMAAGTFIQGASIELSADAPIKEPYIAYMQGGLTYEHIKIALYEILNKLKGN